VAAWFWMSEPEAFARAVAVSFKRQVEKRGNSIVLVPAEDPGGH